MNAEQRIVAIVQPHGFHWRNQPGDVDGQCDCGTPMPYWEHATHLATVIAAELGLSQQWAVCIEDDGSVYQVSSQTYLSAARARNDDNAVMSCTAIGSSWVTAWQLETVDPAQSPD